MNKETIPKILIVDDSPTYRKQLLKALNRNNYSIVEASNGKEAIDILKEEKIDLILLDLVMPIMDGFETLEKLSEHDKWRNIPVIVLSSVSSEEDVIKTFHSGTLDFVHKSTKISVLIEKIKRYLHMKNKMEYLEDTASELERILEYKTKKLFEAESKIPIAKYITSILHNLRNPITYVINGAELLYILIEKLKNEIELQKEKNLEIKNLFYLIESRVSEIKKAGEVLTIQTDLLLKKGYSDLNQEFETIDLNSLIKSEIQFFQIANPKLKDNEINTELKLHESPLIISAVPSLISQIVDNLISNSIKALERAKNPKIRIETGKELNYAWFSVEDNGTGIPEQEKNKIFNLFFKGTKGTNKKETHYGIGLAMVKETIDLHGGKIEVKSKEGVGTKITVFLPIHPQQQKQV